MVETARYARLRQEGPPEDASTVRSSRLCRADIDSFKKSYYTSKVVHMAAPEHCGRSTSHMRWCNRPGLSLSGPNGRQRSHRQRPSGEASAGGRKVTPGGALFVLPKPEAVGMHRRRCGLHGGTAQRDAKAVAHRVDRAIRLCVAMSAARSDACKAPAGVPLCSH